MLWNFWSSYFLLVDGRCTWSVVGWSVVAIWVYLSLHFWLILGGTSFLSFSVLCVFSVMSFESDVLFIELQHNDYSILYIIIASVSAICPSVILLSLDESFLLCKNHVIKIWFWHILVKTICFQRGFELIKNHLRKKCGTVTKRNQKISLVKEIYKVKTRKLIFQLWR